MTSPSGLSVQELADGICVRAGRIAAAQAELLLWIAEFDRREGWSGPGMLSCAHWLSWRVGMSLGTARDQVRVARRLEDLPRLAAAFADGRVSYSKVRAITRVAEPEDAVDWVELARFSSAAQLDKLVRGVHRTRANALAERDPQAAAWRLRTRLRYDEHGNFVLTVRGPAPLLPVVQAGLQAKKAQLQRERALAAQDADGHAAGGHDVARPAAAVPVGSQPSAVVDGSAARATESLDARGSDGQRVDEAGQGLDVQAPGWPVGTTVRQVHEAMDGFAVLQRDLRSEQSRPPHDDPGRPAPILTPVPTPGTRHDTAVPAPSFTPTTVPRAPEEDAPQVTGATQVPDATPVTDVAEGTDVAKDAEVTEATQVPGPDAVTDADALLALAQDALQAERSIRPDLARRRRPQLTAQIDPLSGWARQGDGELLPPSDLAAVRTTLPGPGRLQLRPFTPADLRRYDLGRTAREVSTRLRELLGTLDGERCRFPGCTRHRNLHAHHVVYWSHGGPTDLANLVLVCARHHTLLHAHGFQLVLHPDRRLEVRTADGTPVLHHPTPPWGDPAALASACGQVVSAETLLPEHCTTHLDLHYAVSVLIAQAA